MENKIQALLRIGFIISGIVSVLAVSWLSRARKPGKFIPGGLFFPIISNWKFKEHFPQSAKKFLILMDVSILLAIIFTIATLILR